MSAVVVVFMVSAFAVGMLISAQPALNAILSVAVGGPIAAAVVSIGVTFVCAVLLWLVAGRGTIRPAAFAGVPWWVFLSGVVGMIFVASGIVIAPAIGALLFFACVVAGQLAGAALADHFGAFGLAARELTSGRLIGFGMVLAGVVIVQRC